MMGWETFVASIWGKIYFAVLDDLPNSDRGNLRKYKYRGDPVSLTEGEWSERQWEDDLMRGPK